MEKQWNLFSMHYSLRARDILGQKTPLHTVRSKILAYNTLLLGKQGIEKTLVAQPHDFDIFISDLRAELRVSERQKKSLRKLWKDLMVVAVPENPKKDKTSEKDVRRRYDEYFGSQNQNIGQSICLTASFIYDWLVESPFYDSETTLEAFAGYFNRRLKNWCSLFEDLEAPFGSLGSFFKLGPDLEKFNLIVSNPPYQNPILEATSKILVDHIGSSISIIPDWRSKNEDISKDYVIKGSPIHPSRRWNEPYPAFDLLRNSENYRGTLFFQRVEFSNDLAESPKIPEVSVIVVVLGDVKILETLVQHFS